MHQENIAMGFFNLFSKKEKKEVLDAGLEKTKTNVFNKLARIVVGKSKVDDEVLDDLEDALISSDVGVETTVDIIRRIEDRVARDKYVTASELNKLLRDEVSSLLTESGNNEDEGFIIPENGRPYVILVVGVNGVGKTTTIGKLAYHFTRRKARIFGRSRYISSSSRRATMHLG